MDEDTTTVSDSIELGAEDSAQPVQPVESTEAAAQSPEPTTTTETTETPEANADENVAWLQNKGIDPNDPEAIAKVAKMYRDAERAMHEAKQPKLNDALTEPTTDYTPDENQPIATDPRIDAIILERNVEKFFNADGNPEVAAERKALEPAMSDIVTNNPAIGQMVKAGFMSYEQLAALAKGSDPSYGSKLKQAGGREALETVATRQQARAVQGVATTSAVSGDTPSDPFLDGFNSI
jgi:hypothetical protein